MADTLANIPLPPGVWVNLYTASGATIGDQLTVENTGDNDVYLTVQAFEPELNHNAYNVLRRTDPRLTNSAGDPGAWAFCPNVAGEVNVSVNTLQGFVPAIAVTGTPLSEDQIADKIDEQEYRRQTLAAFDAITHQLCLLNARIEEAFETDIQEVDV